MKKKIILYSVNLILMFFIGVYSVAFGLKKALTNEIYSKPNQKVEIYTVWHIETFEGGSKPRINFLKSIANKEEKENKFVLFNIKQIKPEELENNLKIEIPDIISFGTGVGKIVLPYLKCFNSTFDVRENFLESGMFNSQVYAIPYITSGYLFFENESSASNFFCGKTDYTSPENIYQSLNLTPSKIESQFEAYKSFVNTKSSKLLGTGRDLFRITNLNNIGRTNAQIYPVDSFTDLVQYVGITNNNEITQNFVKNLLSNENQKELSNYSLFSPKYNKIYFSGIYTDMENALFSCIVKNVFN